MADEFSATTVPNDRFESALAELLQAEERGERPDWSRVRRTWPELEDRLREFFRDRDHFARLAPCLAPTPPGVPATPPDLPPGYRLGAYEVLQRLGRGGRGVVYRVNDPELNRSLAVKVLRPELHGQTDAVQRFLEEAQVTGQLQHPGIVPVHAIGQLHDGRPYLAMKLVQGRTLAELLAERSMPSHDLPRFLGVFQQLCQAVAYAHSRGVIHRDLKPSNVMVGEFGEVQVMDWGLAKVLASRGRQPPEEAAAAGVIRTVRTESADQSQSGTVVGTPAYMAPEQARGEVEKQDARSDVFGLGAVLCEILTGAPPYIGRDALAVQIQAAKSDTAEAVARLERCGADAELVRLARACLAPDAADRPADAVAVAQAVTAHRRSVEERLRQAELARVAAQEKALRERQRRRWAVALSASVVLTLAVLAGPAGGCSGSGPRPTGRRRRRRPRSRPTWVRRRPRRNGATTRPPERL
jgi:serine/threonine-protein kinase